jgi:hypothetical protein
VAKEGHHLMEILAQPFRIKMGDDLIEDFRCAILDSANDAEQHPTGHAAPTPVASPRLVLEVLCAVDVALTQRAGRQAIALGTAPPAWPGEGKAPEDGFIFIEQNDLTPAGTVLQGGEFERGRGEVSGVGLKPPGGTPVA